MSVLPDDEDLVGRLRLGVSRLSRALREHDHRALMTPTDAAMLATIFAEGEPTLGRLAVTEHVKPSAVTKSVTTLEALGYVERTIDPNDRRVCRVRLSDSGNAHISEYRATSNAWILAELETLPKRKRARLADAVEIIEHLVESRRRALQEAAHDTSESPDDEVDGA